MKWVMGLVWVKHGQSKDVYFYLPVSDFYSPVMYVCVIARHLWSSQTVSIYIKLKSWKVSSTTNGCNN